MARTWLVVKTYYNDGIRYKITVAAGDEQSVKAEVDKFNDARVDTYFGDMILYEATSVRTLESQDIV